MVGWSEAARAILRSSLLRVCGIVLCSFWLALVALAHEEPAQLAHLKHFTEEAITAFRLVDPYFLLSRWFRHVESCAKSGTYPVGQYDWRPENHKLPAVPQPCWIRYNTITDLAFASRAAATPEGLVYTARLAHSAGWLSVLPVSSSIIFPLGFLAWLYRKGELGDLRRIDLSLHSVVGWVYLGVLVVLVFGAGCAFAMKYLLEGLIVAFGWTVALAGYLTVGILAVDRLISLGRSIFRLFRKRDEKPTNSLPTSHSPGSA
jgi:hypothetical protein